MNPGHLAPVACLSFLLTPSSVFINLCLLLPLFLSTVFLHFSVPLLFFLGIHPFICLFTPALHLLKNYFAHLDGALLARYAISPCAAVIKNRSAHQVRIRRDFSTSLISSCSPLHSHETVLARNGYTIESEKLATKCSSLIRFVFCPESLCVSAYLYLSAAVSVCQWVCVLPADLFAGCCLMSSCVFERLVEVKLLSTPGRRECTDERPLHHPNGIHKPLNQHCCLGFVWVKPRETQRARERGKREH